MKKTNDFLRSTPNILNLKTEDMQIYVRLKTDHTNLRNEHIEAFLRGELNKRIF